MVNLQSNYAKKNTVRCKDVNTIQSIADILI
nr:MAG TPA: hypothetical protein [Caudoviricetes sp.]